MRIDDFCTRFGNDSRSIEAVSQEWHIAEIDRMLADLHADAIGNLVFAGDALHGDGFRDQISPTLRDAFRELMNENADTYNKMREILADRIRDGDGEFLSLHDRRVQGFVSKLKGQIGENLFKKHAGSAARLADSGCQEGWDVVIEQSDGAQEYVQVKLYASPHHVIQKLLEVHEKVRNGLVEGVDGQIIEKINFAIPEDIAAEVQERIASQFPELLELKIHTIRMTATAAADIVHEGLNNVGPKALEHLFGELLGGTVAAAALHGLVNGFLLYRGSKDCSEAFADTVSSTSLSATGIGIAILASTLTNSTPLSMAIGTTGRTVISRFAKSRWKFADFLEDSIEASQQQVAALERMGVRQISQAAGGGVAGAGPTGSPG